MAVQSKEATRVTHRIKTLDQAKLSRLENMEKQLGCCLIALEPQPPMAQLSQEQLRQLQALEKEMNAVLVAYSC